MTSITSDSDVCSNTVSGSDSTGSATNARSDSENSDHAARCSATATNTLNEQNMEISDILSQRIAAKRKDIKTQALKASRIKKKGKKSAKRKQQVKRRRIIASSSSEDEGAFSLETLPLSEDHNPNRGFLSINGILGPPVWYRITDDSNAISDRSRDLRRRRARILLDCSDSDSDTSDASIQNTGPKANENKPSESNAAIVDSGCAGSEAHPNDEVHNETDGEPSSNCDSSVPHHSETVSSNEGSERLQQQALSSENIANDNAPSDSLTQNNSSSQAGPSSASGNITWAEFKRFKNKVKRASRHYRRYRDNDDNSD